MPGMPSAHRDVNPLSFHRGQSQPVDLCFVFLRPPIWALAVSSLSPAWSTWRNWKAGGWLVLSGGTGRPAPLHLLCFGMPQPHSCARPACGSPPPRTKKRSKLDGGRRGRWVELWAGYQRPTLLPCKQALGVWFHGPCGGWTCSHFCKSALILDYSIYA